MLKLLIEREALLKPLQLVTSAVERRQTLAILSHVLLLIKDNRLTLIGTDLEIELCGLIHLEQAQETSAAITLPGKKFLDICRELPEHSMLELIEEHGKVTISSGKSRFVFASLPATDFPRTPNQEASIEFSLAPKALRKILDKTFFAIPQQDVRQYLNGLLLEVTPGQAQALASDGHRLAMSSIPAPTTDNAFTQVIIPRKGVAELSRLLATATKDVLISLNNNFIRVTGEDFILTSKLINGKFPNYNKIIPQRGDKQVIIDCLDLKRALTRVGILSNELFRSARFQLQNNTLVLKTNNPDQEEAVEELAVEYQQEDLDAVFNINYFIDILNAVETPKVCIAFKDNANGVVIEEVAGATNCLYVLMPIRQ